MLLKSVLLRNIRSYSQHGIQFGKGSTLLAGDIGAGKSSILLALEFALFGIKRGELSGGMLLRHGKNEGFVEVKLEVEGKDVIIKRTLKRTKDEVKQDSGYIVVDGLKKECSPIELRAYVLSLLGYPKELLNKPKDLLYRFTVYTPQEEMKAVLAEDKETRLDTLRKVFNIDKYKNIASNASIIVKELKDRKRLIEARTSDIPEKTRLKENLDVESAALRKKIDETKPLKDESARSVNTAKASIAEMEASIKIVVELKKEAAALDAELASLAKNRQKIAAENDALSREIEVLQKEVESFPGHSSKDKLAVEKNVNALEGEVKEILSSISQLKAKKSISEGIKKNIVELKNCPTCFQEVSHEHKGRIISAEESKIMEISAGILEKENLLKIAEENLNAEKSKLEGVRKHEIMREVIKVKAKNLALLKERLGRLALEQDSIGERAVIINAKKSEISGKMDALGDIEERYQKSRKELDMLLQKDRNLEIELVSLEKQNEGIVKQIIALEREIAEKAKLRERMQYYGEMQHWIEDFFVNLVNTMEKQVMVRIHNEFDELFQRWFNVLIEDDAINVRLDGEFTPIIEQNGYESSVENLSGGEKTSVALSYRLALNKVVNDVVSTIKTKDIIILDEPTDGFSSEQLDKVREVLEQLNMKQIIIVSHEPKIESFVDNVIRISKGDEGSVVA